MSTKPWDEQTPLEQLDTEIGNYIGCACIFTVIGLFALLIIFISIPFSELNEKEIMWLTFSILAIIISIPLSIYGYIEWDKLAKEYEELRLKTIKEIKVNDGQNKNIIDILNQMDGIYEGWVRKKEKKQDD